MSDKPKAQTLLLVDDHELVRVGLRQVLVQHFADRFVVADAQSLEQALVLLKERAADVSLVLLDLNLGDTRGLAGLQLLKRLYPHLSIVVVSGSHDARVRAEAMAQGALGFFCKEGGTEDLKGLLAMVEKAHAVRPNDKEANALRAETEAGEADSLARSRRLRPGIRLNKRQIQVLELILRGHDNQAIADETGLALGSVKNCVSTVFLDFNVRSRAELMRLFS